MTAQAAGTIPPTEQALNKVSIFSIGAGHVLEG